MKNCKREYDVLCVGLALTNILIYPFPKKIDGGDTAQVETIDIICGGDAFNQATVLSALGHKVALVSKVADDMHGKLVLDTISARKVDVSMVAFDEEVSTSTSLIMVFKDGQRKFCTYKGCLRTFGMRDINLDAVGQSKIVSIGGLYALPGFDREASIELFRKARQVHTATVLDTKYDAFHIGLAGIKNLLEYTDYFFPSYEEASYLSGRTEPKEIVRFFADKGATHVGVKVGGDGCYLFTKDFEGMIPAFKANVLDTTGAGDNFMGGMIHGILNGWSLPECVLYGNGAGARAVTKMGACDDDEYPETIKSILMQTTNGARLVKERRI